MLRLTPPAEPGPWPVLDPAQQSVVAHRGGVLLVTGAPGSGRTTTALAVTADRLAAADRRAPADRLAAVADGVEPVLLLAPTRRAAARLRDALSAQLPRTGSAPVVRTPSSLAFSVLRARASMLGEPAPTLISGPEQDLVLADLLAGHAAGEGRPLAWPASVPSAALGLRAFRDELRDLLMRAAERGLRPADLARLGAEHGRPAWQAAAALYAEYLDVTVLRAATPDAGARFDPAVVVDEAGEALLAWESEVPRQPLPRWGTVVVDDYQEVTAGTVRLLHTLAAGGAELVLLADPDLAVQTFRGASPGLVDRAALPAGSELGAFGATTLTLGRVWRHGPQLRAVVAAVTAEIRGTVRAHRVADAVGTEAVGSDTSAGTARADPSGGPVGAGGADLLDRPAGAARTAQPDAPASPVRAVLLRSAAQEAAFVAHTLRAAHLYDELPWGRMAVVARSGAQVAELRRALLAAQVPVEVVGSDVPLRAEPAVRPLLRAVAATLVPEPAGLDPADVAELLVSPLGGIDAVGLRRLRRSLRAEEVAAGGSRTSDELLVEAVSTPARAAMLGAPVRPAVVRLAGVLAAGRAALARPGTGVLDVLWALWDEADLAGPWRRSALAGGAAGERADRDLDAVLGLFTAAEQFVDRMPQASAGAFLEHLVAQDLPADSLAARGSVAQAVALVTAAGAAGAEWDLVVVAGVQEGVWPDLRLRDSILGAQHLVDVVAGRAAASEQFAAEARAAVLDDELRTFAVAVSRARRRLVVTAVRDAEQQPSGLLDLVAPPGPGEVDSRLAAVPHALDLRAVVARARTVLEAGEDSSSSAAALLAHLAAEQIPGADPATWYGAAEPSSDAPLWAPEASVPLSPSKLELATTCALRWALEAVGGTSASTTEQSIGLLVHALAAELPHGTLEELMILLDDRWSSLGLPEGWVSRQRRREAEAMLALLAAYLADADEPVALEQGFSARLGRVVLRGSVDRLERLGLDAEGRPLLRVVDLKTGATKPPLGEATEHHAQLGAYQVAVDAGAFDEVLPGAVSAGARLVFVGGGTAKPALRSQEALRGVADPQWAQEMIAGVADLATRSVMDATKGDQCRVCPVQRSCPAWPQGRVVGA